MPFAFFYSKLEKFNPKSKLGEFENNFKRFIPRSVHGSGIRAQALG